MAIQANLSQTKEGRGREAEPVTAEWGRGKGSRGRGWRWGGGGVLTTSRLAPQIYSNCRFRCDQLLCESGGSEMKVEGAKRPRLLWGSEDISPPLP